MYLSTNKHLARFLQIALCCLSLSSCAGQVSTSHAPSADVQIENQSQAQMPSSQEMSQASYAMEGQVADGCLAAWRKATAGNYKDALTDLDALQQNFPKSTTISFMKGQILELSGDKQGAVKFYREGIRDNEYNGIQRFKLAEALRTTGDVNAAEKEYRHLIEQSPRFVDARLGLAKILQQKTGSSVEINKQIQEILKIDPTNKEALAMLKETPKSP